MNRTLLTLSVLACACEAATTAPTGGMIGSWAPKSEAMVSDLQRDLSSRRGDCHLHEHRGGLLRRLPAAGGSRRQHDDHG